VRFNRLNIAQFWRSDRGYILVMSRRHAAKVHDGEAADPEHATVYGQARLRRQGRALSKPVHETIAVASSVVFLPIGMETN
jgi:hypothetical protein